MHLGDSGGQLIVRPAPLLAGLIEIRGLGIRRCDFVPQAAVGLVVDLGAADAERLPPPETLQDPHPGCRKYREFPSKQAFRHSPWLLPP